MKNYKKNFILFKKEFEEENEIRYQLSKSNLGLFVLSDINIQYVDLTLK